MKVVIESGPIRDRRFYHLRATLVCKNKDGVALAELEQDAQKRMDQVLEEAKGDTSKLLRTGLSLVDELLEQDMSCSLKADLRSIDGIYVVGHDDKMILIEKSPAYNWSEIEDQILEVVAKHLEVGVEEFEVEHQNAFSSVGDPHLN